MVWLPRRPSSAAAVVNGGVGSVDGLAVSRFVVMVVTALAHSQSSSHPPAL